MKNQPIARIVAHYRDKYRIWLGETNLWAEISGKLRFSATSQADYPVVGDWVKIEQFDDDQAVIHEIIPRKTLLQRKAAGKNKAQVMAANIDVAFIVQAVDRDFNLNRFERYLSLTASAKIKPAIVLNKTDLISKEQLEELANQTKKRFKNVKILTTSVTIKDRLEELAKAIKKDKTYCFLGSSGVGKSSIINKLLGKDALKTKEISLSTKKGKHTTTHRELFVLKNGGFVIDTPGLREVGLADADQGVASVFAEIAELGKNCKFSDCSHQHEANCAVLKAVETGEIDQAKYSNYLKLKKEADYYSMSKLEKRHKDRAFGKMVHNVMKHKKKMK